ncbi:MAG: MarR family transcriptional regulator [Beijerinckiaceae bacterium]|nr:MarR family transcriptional regulator [Beijerinckiaceae bacterium]
MPRPLKRELMFQLVETARLLRTYVDQRARQNGTTRAQWGVLARLRRQEGLNQAALAEQLEMQPISLARLIDRLEGQALVERRADPRDRRAYLLHLTPDGRQLVDDLDALRGDIAGEVLDGIEETAIKTALETLAAIRERTRTEKPARSLPAAPAA